VHPITLFHCIPIALTTSKIISSSSYKCCEELLLSKITHSAVLNLANYAWANFIDSSINSRDKKWLASSAIP